jgi:hypothetical protein
MDRDGTTCYGLWLLKNSFQRVLMFRESKFVCKLLIVRSPQALKVDKITSLAPFSTATPVNSKGTKKVDIARRMMLAVNPKMRIETFACNWQLAAHSIREADVIVSCVDSYAARQDIEGTARRFLVPLLDRGMDVHLVDEKPHMSGQVILSLPGSPCMKCLGFLNDNNCNRKLKNMARQAAVRRWSGQMEYSHRLLSDC